MTNNDSVLVIAEAGVNHNGDLTIAKKLVDAAKDAGADVVKFQTFKAENLASCHAAKADYQKQSTDAGESQLEMLRSLELSVEAHELLMAYCEQKGITFMSTPFDLESLQLLIEKFDLPWLKLGSGELTNAPLLVAAARSGKPLILSTGMGTLLEVEEALGVLAFGYLGWDQPSRQRFQDAFASEAGNEMLHEKVTLLHCTTEYPTPFADVNLRAMETISEVFGLRIGFSDHTEGWAMPIAAVARGAMVVEKHFTLDRTLPGPDHKASLEPDDLKSMVTAIRQVEVAMGSGLKIPAASEKKNMAIARKSLVASSPIMKGETFSEQNLTVKRPGDGVTPYDYWTRLGTLSEYDFEKDELIR